MPFPITAFCRILTAGFGAAVFLAAQNPPVLDNDQVDVLKVTDQPHAKSAPHQHKFNRVMIYLQPGRQEIIRDGKKEVTQLNAGEVKWSPAGGTHTSEIISDAPVSMIEVEIKKPGDPGKQATTALDPLRVDPQDYKLEFENSQVRVIRVKMGPHHPIPLHEHMLNRVSVYLTDQYGNQTTPDGVTTTTQHKAGEVAWGGPLKHKEQNLSDKPLEVVVVELKD